MGDDEPAVVEHVVRHKGIEEVYDLPGELGWLRVELRHGLRKTVGQRNRLRVSGATAALTKDAEQLVLVISAHAERTAVANHRHDQSQDSRRVRATVHQIPDEDRCPSGLGRYGADNDAVRVGLQTPPDLAEQCGQLGEAAVDVTDDVERAVPIVEVAEQGGTHDGRGIDVRNTIELMDVSKPFFAQALPIALQVRVLAFDNADRDVCSIAGTPPQLVRRDVQDDGDR